MATARQKAALAKMVETGRAGKPVVVGKIMREVGYSPNTAIVPGKLTESKGFLDLCEKYGLTDKLIITSLVEDIKAKPKNRKPELELAAKIKGRLKESGPPAGGNTFNLTQLFIQTQSPKPADVQEVNE